MAGFPTVSSSISIVGASAPASASSETLVGFIQVSTVESAQSFFSLARLDSEEEGGGEDAKEDASASASASSKPPANSVQSAIKRSLEFKDIRISGPGGGSLAPSDGYKEVVDLEDFRMFLAPGPPRGQGNPYQRLLERVAAGVLKS
jgi:hypothetical protein